MVWDSYEKRIVPMGPPSALFVRTEVLTLSGLRFHHLIIPIAAAMVAIGLAVIKASRSLGILEILGPDLVLAIGSVLIVFGVFCIASYGLVRAIEWADQGISREERTHRARGRVSDFGKCVTAAQALIEIDHYGERLVGCMECNRWSWRGSQKLLL